MRFTHTPKGEEQLTHFLELVEQARDGIILRSPEGDTFNLKSFFSRYMGIGKLLEEKGDYLELFCQCPLDESLFYEFFSENPDVL